MPPTRSELESSGQTIRPSAIFCTHHCAMFGTFHTWYSRCCTWCCHVWEHACGIIWMHASCNCQLFQLKLKRLAFSSQPPIFFKRVNHSPRSSCDTNRSSKACQTYRVPLWSWPKGAMISSGSHGATKDDGSRKPGVAFSKGRPLTPAVEMMPWGGWWLRNPAPPKG